MHNQTSNFKKVFISTISRFSYQILSMIVLILLTPFVIKTLGDYKYGIWVLVSIIISYYGYTELGITSAVERNLAVAIGENDKNKFNEIFSNGLFLNILIFILITFITIASCLVINFIKIENYKLISLLVIILGINLASTFPFKSFSSVLSSNIRFEVISIIQSAQIIINTILTVITLLCGYALVGLALSSLISTLIANFLYYYSAKKTINYLCFQKELINKNVIKNLLKYSGKTFIAQLSDILRFKLDEIVTATFISVSMVTTYSIATKLNNTSNSVGIAFLGVLTPLFSYSLSETKEKQAKLFFSASKVIICISFLFFACFLLLGKQFINLWLGPNYLDSYYPLIILGFAYFIAYSQTVGLNYMLSSNTHQYFAYISIFEGILNLILSVTFVGYLKLGIIGISLGTLIPICVTKFIFQPLIMSKLLEIKPLKYYSFFGKNFLLAFIVYIPAGILITNLNIANYFILIFTGFILIMSAFVHLLLMLDKEEKYFFHQKLKAKRFLQNKFKELQIEN